MLKNKSYRTLNLKFAGLFVLSFFFFISISSAQGQEKVILEDPVEENPLMKESSKEVSSLIPSQSLVKKEMSTLPKESELKGKQPEGGIAEVQKTKKEENSSTLSFNLFLYIVDKFKAD